MGATAGLATTAIGTGASIYGLNQEGAAKAEAGEFIRDQYFSRAEHQRAASQREAAEQLRQARLVESRARAVAAGTGGGVDDPTVDRILRGIEAEGAYRAMTVLYEGEQQAVDSEVRGVLAKGQGDAAKHAFRAEAANTVVSAMGSMQDGIQTMGKKYGGTGYKGGGYAGGHEMAQEGDFLVNW